ncbi:MAG: TolC family protein [Bacteroidetes bacterium]|nr:TolC family protein [Bacteroidota bacterium]
MNRLLIRIFLFVLVSSGAAAQEVLRLEDAIAIGLERNHRILVARAQAQIARNNTTFGTANFLPTLDATGSYSFSHSEQETNSPFSFGNSDTRSAGAQLALNWTLFDGFRMFVDQERYDALAHLGEAQARSTIERTVISIAAAYFRLVQQTQLLDTFRKTLDISRTRFEKEAVRRELGGSTSDYLNARIAFHNDSTAVLEQQLQWSIARKDLNLLLGRSAGAALDVERRITIPEISWSPDRMLTMARTRNAELIVARQSLQVAESSAGLSRSAFYPRVNLFANYGYSDRLVSTAPNERFAGDITTLSADAAVGLSFTFNLFNGFRNSAEVENAVLASRQASLLLDEAEKQLEGLLLERHATLQTRLDAIAIEELNLDAARQNLALQIERFETGTVSSLEFRDAQLQFVRAEAAWIVSLFEARIALLELQRLVGDIRL